MGLDVITYGNIKLAKNEEDADFVAYVINEKWKHKVKNLQYGKAYNGDVIFKGVSYSYSTHSRFREGLVRLIGREDLLDSGGKIKWNKLPAEIPFYDLINFADDEGCLDWEVSSTILSDFEEYNEKAKLEMNPFDYSKYETWLETFKYAKNNGVVVFY
jgi:hypothetical protein